MGRVLPNTGAQSAMAALAHLCTWRIFLIPCDPRPIGGGCTVGRSAEKLLSDLRITEKSQGAVREKVVVKSLLVVTALIALSGPVMAQDKEMRVTPDALTWKENPA